MCGPRPMPVVKHVVGWQAAVHMLLTVVSALHVGLRLVRCPLWRVALCLRVTSVDILHWLVRIQILIKLKSVSPVTHLVLLPFNLLGTN